MKHTARTVVCLLAVLLLVSALPLFAGGEGEEGGQKKYVLRFNHVLTEKDPYHQAYLEWADAVAERTDGNLTIEVFHSSQLGVEEDIIEQIRQGANVGQNTDSARLGNYVPDIAVMNGPYFADTLEEVQTLNTLATVDGWKKQLEEQYGIKVLSFSWVQGFRNMLTNKPIYSPADMKGLLIRSPNAPIWMESIRSLGATPVALNYGEVYSGVQTKVVDGAGNVYPATYSTRMYEVLDYLSETQHIMLINFAICSADWFNNLPAEYQTILEEECENAGLRVSRRIMGELADDAKVKLQEEGMTIIPHSEIDIAAFKKNSIAAYEALGLLDVRNQIFKEMGK
ncbi:C4-dicarboxylate TRAP transporter substrate-binding protein [Marispirochaeta aestuarii]|uniref:C4-dicarboxylate TRAP transporter substrate-binding protein n=1 Tax=Marispirochaeta aestuarii TaxID=1963862 RepID=UPI0029C7D9B8|nr:C4-dicarboxylate TRAP transporter substrate-binding protein [Marispirochaeta aestuarii]